MNHCCRKDLAKKKFCFNIIAAMVSFLKCCIVVTSLRLANRDFTMYKLMNNSIQSKWNRDFKLLTTKGVFSDG